MKLKDAIDKYTSKKHLIIILILGIVIMLLPNSTERTREKQIGQITQNSEKINEKELERVLKKINGIEDVDIFITYRNSGTDNYAYDIRKGSNQQEIEIIMSDDAPVISETENPEIEGILVVIKGKSLNKIELSNMIKSTTGVPLHRICIKISEGE